MQANVGKVDKNIRLIAGVAIIAAGVYYKSWWGAIGIAPLATAFMNWCPGYLPLGISTCEKKDDTK